MKKKLSILMLMAALIVPWASRAQNCTQTVPYSENFESYAGVAYNATSGRILPTCWNGYSTIANYIPCVVSGTGSYVYYHGAKSMAMTGGTATTYGMNKYVLLPPMNVPLSQLQLSFWMCTESSSATYGVLHVGYVTSDDTATFVSIANYPSSTATYHGSNNGLMAAGVGLEVELALSQVPASATRLAFKWEHANSSYHTCCIDDVVVDYLPTCPKPTAVTLGAVTQDGATISWSNPAGASSFLVYYDTTPNIDITTAATYETVNDTVVELSNLEPLTTYYYVIVADCGGGDVSLPTLENQFTTKRDCGADFVNINDPIGDGTSASYTYLTYNYNSTSYALGHSANIFTAEEMMELGVEGPATIHSISLHAGATATSVPMRIYIGKTALTSFTAATDTVGMLSHMTLVFDSTLVTTANQWVTIPFSTPFEYSPDSSLIVYYYRPSLPTGNGTFYYTTTSPEYLSYYGYRSSTSTSNLSFTRTYYRVNTKFDICYEVPACAMLRNPRVDSLSVDWANISWSDQGTGSSWIVEYDTVDFVPGSGAAAFTAVASDTTYLMNNLDTGYTYHVYVRANCGSDTSIFMGFTVTTLASLPAEVPYFCNFEGDLTDGWDLVNGTQHNFWTVGTATNNGGSKSLYVTNNGTAYTYDGTESYAFATRTFTLTEAGEYAYSYDWKCNGESSFDFLRVALVPASTAITAGSYCGFNNAEAPSGTMPTGGIALDGGGRLNLQSTWQTQNGTFTLTTPGTYKWVFLWRNDPSVYNLPPAAIDNINLVRNTCPAPSNLVANHVTADSIVVSWNSGGNESTWEVSNGVDTYETSDSTYTFDNLNSSTGYTITVRSICDAGDTSMVISTTVYTECLYAALPLTENFDGITGSTATTSIPAGFQPPCWNIYNDGTRASYQYAPYVYSSSSYSHSGSNCIRFYSYNSSGDSSQYLILPAVDPDEYLISDLQLSFWLRGNSTSSGYFANVVVGVMTNPADESSFIPYDTINYASTTYAYQEVNFNHYTGPHGRVTMMFPKPLSSGQYEYGYIDDVMLGLIPSCLSVENLTAAYASSDTIILSWVPAGTENEWMVTYDSGSFTVNDTFFVADNLSPNTEYTFHVYAICGSGDTSYPVNYTTRTGCGPITVLPYFESFETYPVGSSTATMYEIPCWARLDDAGQNHFGYVNNASAWSAGPHTGDKFLYYYLPTTQGTHANWLLTILPSIDTDVYAMNSLQLSFWVRMNSASTSSFIEVGVISDITDETTFTPVDTIPVTGDVHTMKTAYLSSFTGFGDRIAMRFHRTTESTAHYFFIDDITIEPIPACPPVTNIALADIDSNMLSVTWTENGAAASWNVEYGPHGFTPGNGTTAVASTLPFVINGLTPNTEYDVYITPECNSGTAATRMGTFRTANVYIQLPFSCGFEDSVQNTLWTIDNGSLTNKWYIGTATHNGTGTHALYISDNNGTSNTYTITASGIVFAFVDVMLSTPGDYAYSFDWKAQGESTFDYIRAALVPVSETFTPGTALPTGLSATAMPASWISLDGNSKLNLQGSWQTRSDVVTVTSAGVYHLLFVWRNDGSGGTTPPAAIDNVELALMTCPRPQNITLSNLTQTGVDIAWVEPATATEWQYQLGSGTLVTVTDTTCTLTGLVANTEYTFRVRSICGQGDTSMWITYTFRTPCGYVNLPYIQDFEAESTTTSTSASFANCMTRLNNGTTYFGYPYISSTSTYNHTANGTKGLYWYGSTTTGTYGDYQYVVLPPVDVTTDPINTLQLSFWAKASSSSYNPVFHVGVMTNPNDTAITVLDTITINGNTTWTEYTVTLNNYIGTGEYVAIRALRPTSAWYAYVDDIMLDHIPTCPAVTQLVTTNATTTSITIDWTDVATGTPEWQVSYSNGTATQTTIVTSHPATISGLSALTGYTFKVRPICSVGDTGHWSMEAMFSTTMCDNAVIASTGASDGTGYTTPVNNLWKYTLSETIIDSAELAGIGDITSIAYSYAYSTAMTDKTDVTIWLQPTNKTAFASSSDLVVLDTTIAVQVYHGDLNCSLGWNYFSFTAPYTWDGHSNLLVIVDDNSNDYNSSTYVFDKTSCTEYKTIEWHSDSYNPDPTSTSYSGTKNYYQYRATMQLISCGAGCANPSSLHTTSVTYNSVEVAWSGTDSAEVGIHQGLWDETGATIATVTTSSYTFTGLTPNTPYTFAVRNLCPDDMTSDWVYLPVTTDDLPCFAPSNIQVSNETTNGGKVTWTPGGNETEWIVNVFRTGIIDTNITVINTPMCNVSGLYAATTYTISVASVCGGIDTVWCDTTATLTTTACLPPTEVTAVANGRTAIVTWEGSGANEYHVLWYLEDFTTGADSVVVTNGTTNATITGLAQGETYDIYVYAYCDGQRSAQAGQTQVTITGIDDVNSSLINLYPNPANTTVTVDGIQGEALVTIVDMNGRTVFSEKAVSKLTIDLNGMAKGAYFVRITGENTTAIRKLIVK